MKGNEKYPCVELARVRVSSIEIERNLCLKHCDIIMKENPELNKFEFTVRIHTVRCDYGRS